MTTAQQHYNAVSRDYALKASEFADLATKAADAEGRYKRGKAVFKTSLRDRGECRSDAEAETRADADDEIGGLLQERLLTAAVRDAAEEKLRQLRAQLDYGREVIKSDRDQDRLHAQGPTP